MRRRSPGWVPFISATRMKNRQGSGLKKLHSKAMARAMYYLSLIYVRGNVFGADPMLAFEWLKKAAENGFTEAMCKLGIMHCLGHGV